MCVSFVVELPTFQCITTAVSDNKQYLLHFSAAVVVISCASFIVLAESVKCPELYIWSDWEKVTADS
jgi:hypothetical protein